MVCPQSSSLVRWKERVAIKANNSSLARDDSKPTSIAVFQFYLFLQRKVFVKVTRQERRSLKSSVNEDKVDTFQFPKLR